MLQSLDYNNTIHVYRMWKLLRLGKQNDVDVREEYRFEESEEDVGVYSAFMSLVQHDDCVLRQIRINQTLAQQHTVRHVLDHRLRAGAVFEPNCVANLIQYHTPASTAANALYRVSE